MATSGQFPGKVSGAAAGTGKDPRASTAFPGTGKPAAPQRPSGGGGMTGKIIIAGVIFLIVLVVANVVFLALQKEQVKGESDFNQAGQQGEILGKLGDLQIQINGLKQSLSEQKKEIERMRIDVKNNKSQVDFLSQREMIKH